VITTTDRQKRACLVKAKIEPMKLTKVLLTRKISGLRNAYYFDLIAVAGNLSRFKYFYRTLC